MNLLIIDLYVLHNSTGEIPFMSFVYTSPKNTQPLGTCCHLLASYWLSDWHTVFKRVTLLKLVQVATGGLLKYC